MSLRSASPLLGLLALALPASADTLLVPEEYATIQAAMDAAQEGDTVSVADGVYTGSGNTWLSFNGKGFLLRSRNGPAGCVIDCEGSSIAFWLVADEPPTAIVEGFTVRNGNGQTGGAVFLHHAGQPTFRDCTFRNNVSTGGGGAIMAENTSSLTLLRCTFERNQAAFGGALVVFDGASALVEGCRFVENTSTGDGGAIWSGSNGSVSVRSTELTRNAAAGHGGAVFVRSGTPGFRGCTLASNTAGGFGGALACMGPAEVLLSDDIAWNDTALSGSELALLTDPDLGGATLEVRYSDIQGGQAGIRVEPGSSLVYGLGNIDLDPGFVDAPGGDYHLTLASPARDAGDPMLEPRPGAVDIDGEPRIYAPRVDMGADEVHPVHAVR